MKPRLTPAKKPLHGDVIVQWIDARRHRFAVFDGLDPSKHWSLTMVAIISRLGYEPKPELLAGRVPEDPKSISIIDLVLKHMGKDMLDDLDCSIELFGEARAGVSAIQIEDEDGEPIPGVDAVVVGVDGITDAPDTTHSENKTWASW